MSLYPLTYSDYLTKIKELPTHTLSIPEMIKHYRKEFNISSENELFDLIIMKYLSSYGLYDIIYNFYWQLACEKKINYPLSSLMSTIKAKGINFEFKLIKRQIENVKSKKPINNLIADRINSVEIYELNESSNRRFAFYSLHPNTLNINAL